MSTNKYKIMSQSFRELLLRKLDEMENECIEKQLKKSFPSLQWFEEEFKEIGSEFKNFSFDEDKKELVVHTDNIVISTVNFGPFEIRLSIHTAGWNESWGVDLRCIALKPRYPIISQAFDKAGLKKNYFQKYTHPHVFDNDLCTGDQGSEAIEAAINNLRIADVFFIINSILRGYDGNESFKKISHWKKPYCFRCKFSKPIEEIYICVSCQTEYCINCMSVVCSEKGCNSGICKQCKERSKKIHKCLVHDKVIGRYRYIKPFSFTSNKDTQDKFNMIKGWAF